MFKNQDKSFEIIFISLEDLVDKKYLLRKIDSVICLTSICPFCILNEYIKII